MKRMLAVLTLFTLAVPAAAFATDHAAPAVDSGPVAAVVTPETGALSDPEATSPSQLQGELTSRDLSLESSNRSWASGCSASFPCGDGTTAACTGTTCGAYTLAVPAFVKCNGTKYYCPNMCFVNVGCPPVNGGAGSVFCSSNVGNCQQGSNWVRCDGNRIDCPVDPPIDFP